uniref:Uncharacterized protein n=1 Tax=Trichogramma kaykai TaxID=54128 RepID=A0ABD2WEY2_9HYME
MCNSPSECENLLSQSREKVDTSCSIRDCKNIAYHYTFLCCWRALLRLHAMLRRNVAATAAASNSHALVRVFVCSTRRLRATLPAIRPAVLLSSGDA